jgi:hypothetical protein
LACSAAPEDGANGEAISTTSQASWLSCGTGESDLCAPTGHGEVKCVCTPNTTWTPLAQTPGSGADAMWLMDDGTVLALLDSDSKSLSKLTPSSTGSYANGTWASAGSMLLAKRFFASQVLSTGQLVSCGGEYTGPGLPQTESGFCEVYDPGVELSVQVTEPPGWGAIGDSPSTVLPNGEMLMGNTQGMGNQAALLNPSSQAWTIVGGDSDNEEGYVLLQTGDVLTANVYNQGSERYTSASAAFIADAPVPVVLGANSEIGPGTVMMDGRVIWFGASGHTAIYTPVAGQQGSWVAGPDMPVVNGDALVASDVPALLEPNGRVLVVGQGATSASAQFIEYVPASNSFALVGSYGPSGFNDNEYVRMLLLPNGHALVSFWSGQWFDVAFSTGPEPQWAPTITSFPSTVDQSATVTLSGTQLCGLSEVSTYGDDNQQAENYPMVRLTSSTGAVTYLNANGVSTRSIAPNQAGSVSVDIPSNLAVGSYTLNVVAMGIPSNSVAVQVVKGRIVVHPGGVGAR